MPNTPEYLRREAKKLRRSFADGDVTARARVETVLGPRDVLKHAEALHVMAREDGHDSWPKLKMAAEIAAMDRDARAERLKRALYFGQPWVIDQLLAADPELGDANFGLQIALLRVGKVADTLTRDPKAATRPIGIRSPILHLAFSQHHKTGAGLAEASVAIAEMLVRHGADVNDSYPSEPGSPHELSALYGAIGHADNMALGRWLLEQGADPNDNESLYHSTELGHHEGLRMLLEHGALADGTNALLRAMDFDDVEAVRMLLDAGASPNERPAEHPSGQPPVVIPGLHQAARRMCSADLAQVLIDHGADGTMPYQGHTAFAMARMRGNAAVASVLEAAGQASPLNPSEALMALAADGQVDGRLDPKDLTDEQARMITRILGFDGTLPHVKRLIQIGIDPNTVEEQDMDAIHIAGWEGHADAVEYLLTLGPDLERKNMYGGDLMGTVIHGAEFCPAKDRRDHLRCAELVLGAGSCLHAYDIKGCGVEALAAFLSEWAEANPGRVVQDV